jgi:MFS family permease
MTAYMLTLAVFIPMSGWVADRFGARTVFGSAIGIGLELVGQRPTPWPEISFCLLLSAIMSLLLVRHSSAHPFPSIDFSPMRRLEFSRNVWLKRQLRLYRSVERK